MSRRKLPRVVSRADLAELLDLSLNAVDAMTRRGCPHERPAGPGKPFRFDVAKVVAWREQQAAARSEASAGDLVSLNEARQRKLAAEAALAELALDKQRGDVVRVDTVVAIAGSEYSKVQRRFLRLPSKMAPKVVRAKTPAKVQHLLELEVREILTELSTPEEVAEQALPEEHREPEGHDE